MAHQARREALNFEREPVVLNYVETVHRPTTISEALELLRRAGNSGCIIAGGTDLILHDSRLIRSLVDITRLDLSYIREERGRYRFGAGTSIAAIAGSQVTRNVAEGVIARAAATWGSMQISNVATLGGNLAYASPAADMAPPLLALGAAAVVQSPRGRRLVSLAKFWRGLGRTVIRRGLLVEIQVRRPVPPNRLVGSFQKLAPIGDNVAIASVAIALEINQQHKCSAAGIALGALGPTPIRALVAERLLVGRRVKASIFEDVCRAVARSTSPVSDFRASAEYRREMSRVLTRRALEEILPQIEQGL